MDQKFCRSCGMSLETVSRAVASHQSAPGSNEQSVKDESRAVRRMGMMLFWGIVVMLLGGVLLGIDKKLLHNDLAGMIGLVMVIAGPILSAYAVISPLWQQTSKSAPVSEPKITIELESNIRTSPEELPAPRPSITEQTTNILEIEAAKPPSDDRSKEIGAKR
jgi:predicted lipid-binding transport protein (Tim44 family)